jgi:hypothetical protein
MTMTAFKMDLMEPAIGMKRFIRPSRTPTMISVTTMSIKGMIHYPDIILADAEVHCGAVVLTAWF